VAEQHTERVGRAPPAPLPRHAPPRKTPDPSSGPNLKALHSKRYLAFLKRLREAREVSGLTQVEAAKRLRTPQSWISKCERGERRVDFVELEDFARIYGQELDFFRTGRRQ